MTSIRTRTTYNPFAVWSMILAFLFFAGVALLIAAYIRNVDLRHGIAENRNKLQTIETENAELSGKMLSVLDTRRLEEFALSRGLVRDDSPKYQNLTLTRSNQWAILASQ